MIYSPMILLWGSQVIFSFCHCKQCHINIMFIKSCIGTLFLLKCQKEMNFKCFKRLCQIAFPKTMAV